MLRNAVAKFVICDNCYEEEVIFLSDPLPGKNEIEKALAKINWKSIFHNMTSCYYCPDCYKYIVVQEIIE